ncbi:MAG: radical SAM protein [Firmicutes bacterium]|nr:radical SAM protein [Bacillota bacterium]
MRVVLIATYELGRQPFGLASPAAWLRQAGCEVCCLDLSREPFREEPIQTADLVAFYVPMHTATRLAIDLIAPVRALNPRAQLCFYGLYAPVHAAYLQQLGVQTILGGEFEARLVELVRRLSSAQGADKQDARAHAPADFVSLERLQFRVPDRRGLPPLTEYARLVLPGGERRVVGYTEASRGCKHWCRHCPVVPVYRGRFRVVAREVVLADLRQQVAAGAQHITFGDPDFFNGPRHALEIVDALHREFPQVTYDVTIKVEHLLRHAALLPRLRATGCLFVTTAVESVDDAVLARLEKGHTRADFLRALALCRQVGLELHPTFVPFTPWTTLEGYAELLHVIAEQNLTENVAPIQLAIRLLIPAGSRLLELAEVRAWVESFDAAALVYPWRNPDPRVEALQHQVQHIVHRSEALGHSRTQTFARIWRAAAAAIAQAQPQPLPPLPEAVLRSRAAIPYLNEPWYC